MPDEKIKLGIDYGEAKKDTIDLAGVLDKLKTAADATGGELGELVGKTAETAKGFTELYTKAKESEEKAVFSLGALGTGFGQLFQAFKGDGGLTAGIDGVSQLAKLVPPLAPFGPFIDAGATALKSAVPLMKDWYKYVKESGEASKELAQSVNDYAKGLEKANEALKVTDELEKARAADKAARAKPSEEASERSKRFTSGIAGGEEEAIGALTDQIDSEKGKGMRQAVAEQAQQDYLAAVADMFEKAHASGRSDDWIETERQYLLARAKRQLGESLAKLNTRAKAQTEAEELVGKAKAGDAEALDELQSRFDPFTQAGGAARNASPEQITMEQDARMAREANKQFRADQARRLAEDQARTVANRKAMRDKAALRTPEQEAAEEKAEKDAADEDLRKNGVPVQGPELRPFEFATKQTPVQRRAQQDADRKAAGKRRRAVMDAARAREDAERKNRVPKQPKEGQERSAPQPAPDAFLPLLGQLTTNQAMIASNDSQRIEQMTRAAIAAGAQLQSNRTSGSMGFMA